MSAASGGPIGTPAGSCPPPRGSTRGAGGGGVDTPMPAPRALRPGSGRPVAIAGPWPPLPSLPGRSRVVRAPLQVAMLCTLLRAAPASLGHPVPGCYFILFISPGAPLCFLGEGCKRKREVARQSQAQSQLLEHRGGARDGTLNWKCDLGGGRTGLGGCHLGAVLALECLLILTHTPMHVVFNSLVCNLGTLHSLPLLPLQPPRPSSALLVLGWGIRENLARLASVRKEAL